MGSNISCSICHENFQNLTDIYSTTCGHAHHYQCLQEWYKRNKYCPKCDDNSTGCHQICLRFKGHENNLEEANNKLVAELKTNKARVFQLQAQNTEKDNTIRQLNIKMNDLDIESKLAEKKLQELQEIYNKNTELNKKLQSDLKAKEKEFVQLQIQYKQHENTIMQLKSNEKHRQFQSQCNQEVQQSKALMKRTDLASAQSVEGYTSPESSNAAIAELRQQVAKLTAAATLYNQPIINVVTENKLLAQTPNANLKVKNTNITKPKPSKQHSNNTKPFNKKSAPLQVNSDGKLIDVLDPEKDLPSTSGAFAGKNYDARNQKNNSAPPFFEKARMLKKYGYDCVYFHSGKVFAKNNKGDAPIHITSEVQIDELILKKQEEIKKTLTKTSPFDLIDL